MTAFNLYVTHGDHKFSTRGSIIREAEGYTLHDLCEFIALSL